MYNFAPLPELGPDGDERTVAEALGSGPIDRAQTFAAFQASLALYEWRSLKSGADQLVFVAFMDATAGLPGDHVRAAWRGWFASETRRPTPVAIAERARESANAARRWLTYVQRRPQEVEALRVSAPAPTIPAGERMSRDEAARLDAKLAMFGIDVRFADEAEDPP